MKIHIISGKGNLKSIGGGSVSTNTLADTLERRGHDITFTESPREVNSPDVVLHTNIKYLVQNMRLLC